MSRKIILIKQELLLLVYELNRSGLLADNEKIRPILAQLERLLLCEIGRASCRERVEMTWGSWLPRVYMDWRSSPRWPRPGPLPSTAPPPPPPPLASRASHPATL